MITILFLLPSVFVTALIPQKRIWTRQTLLRSSLKKVESKPNILSPLLTEADLRQLASKGYIISEKFLSPEFVQSLRKDIDSLRKIGRLTVAKIGQDSTNNLNTNIRVAETVFIGESKLKEVPNNARFELYQVLENLRSLLSGNQILNCGNRNDAPTLDRTLSEFLYAYYPKGGFYRRHMDSVPNSASALREYSLLIYLNENWDERNGGYLRIHRDSGRDFLPSNEQPNYFDVKPEGGTLVLFKSDRIPHEVLDTNAERAVVVGWYNRPFTSADVSYVTSEQDKLRVSMLMVASALVLTGFILLLNQ